MSICLKLDDIAPHFPLPGAERRIVCGEQLMFAKIEIVKGTEVPSHRHFQEQITYILEGSLQITWGEEEKVNVLGAGELVFYTSDTPHAAKALEDTVVLEAFSPVVDAYLPLAIKAGEHK